MAATMQVWGTVQGIDDVIDCCVGVVMEDEFAQVTIATRVTAFNGFCGVAVWIRRRMLHRTGLGWRLCM